ncbi:uncharacterized protein LOC106089513 [Stomoxys calcitrans]|uniref:uncharacterized protein LOC106089513 n=1 Tax=Stomoxys calcitrans TaxID=35570 RepID=UPI0027E2DD78|nr:uncharacterized protein LOC106089513 [Stomoxys calcitrans]
MRVLGVLVFIAFAAASNAAYSGKWQNILYARYVCSSKPNGYRTLVPGSCSQFYECQFGRSLLRSCPHYFDGTKRECVIFNPGCVESFENLAKDTEVLPEIKATTVAPSASIAFELVANPFTKDHPRISKYLETICHAKADGTLLSSLTRCNEFYRCHQGKVTIQSCGERYFNPEREVCDLPKHTKCLVKNPTEEGATDLVDVNTDKAVDSKEDLSEKKNNKLYLKVICLTKPNGFYLASFTSCNEYYICSMGQAIVKTCGDNYFDSHTGSCGLPENTKCILKSHQEEKEEVAKPITEESEPEIPNIKETDSKHTVSSIELYKRYVCRDKPNGVFIISLEKCNEFYVCEDGTAQVQSCGELHFNSLKGSCDLAENSHCLLEQKQKKAAAVAGAAAMLAKPSSISLYETFVCRNKSDGQFLVSLEKCNEYYICQKGLAVVHSCGDLYFNIAKGVCDLPQNTRCSLGQAPAEDNDPKTSVAGSDTHSATYGTSDMKIPAEDLYHRFVCRGKPNDFLLASLKSCNEYYVCRDGIALTQNCGKKYFNAAKGICDMPENTECKLSKRK